MRALLSILALTLALPAVAQTATFPRHIGAEGSAEIRIRPDRAAVRFGVQHQATDARKAQEKVNAEMQRVVQALRKQGVPEARISTERLELSPVYDYGKNHEGPPRLTGFRASNVVRVEVEVQPGKDAGVGQIIDTAVTTGVNSIEGIEFYLLDEAPARRQALAAAAQEARRRAETLAGAVGAKLGELLAVTDGSVDIQPPPMPMYKMERAMASTAAPVQPGELTVRAVAEVRYAIAQ